MRASPRYSSLQQPAETPHLQEHCARKYLGARTSRLLLGIQLDLRRLRGGLRPSPADAGLCTAVGATVPAQSAG